MTTDLVREGLHLLAGILIWPVLVSLLLVAAATLVGVGAFLREAWDRRRGHRRSLLAAQAARDAVDRTPGLSALDLRLEDVLQRHEAARWRSVRHVKMAVRVGPALGLMGTLIPMADALQGLADGNLPALASNMVTAFAATVVGLTVSVLAYVITTIREDWVRGDVQALAFHAEHVLEARSARSTPAQAEVA
jgi:biopolymer transport protein ExbB/TolQ